jgi:hypothetical protein
MLMPRPDRPLTPLAIYRAHEETLSNAYRCCHSKLPDSTCHGRVESGIELIFVELSYFRGANQQKKLHEQAYQVSADLRIL